MANCTRTDPHPLGDCPDYARRDYVFSADPRVREAEAAWLRAIDDGLPHGLIAARWDAVVAARRHSTKGE